MKNCLIIIFSLLILISCKNHNDINDKSKRNANWTWRVDDITKKGKWLKFVDSANMRDGSYLAFYSNGSVYSKRHIVDYKNIDTVYWYDLKGEIYCYDIIKSDTTYSYFIKDGYIKIYNNDETLASEGNIKNHTFYGIWINYYANGNKESIQNITKDSAWIINCYESGRKRDSSFYFSNRNEYIVCEKWFENGNIQEIDPHINGLEDGTRIKYYKKNQESSTPELVTNYKKGIQTGPELEYYENGQLKDSGYLNKGKISGISKYWNQNGKLEMISTIQNGYLIHNKKYNEKGILIKDSTF